MSKYRPLYSVKTNSAGKQVAIFDKPFVFHCNCPGIVTNVVALVKDAGITGMPVVALSYNKILKEYIESLGIYAHFTTIIKKYGVIVNPLTGVYRDIGTDYKRVSIDKNLSNEQKQEERDKILQSIRDIYNGN